MGRDIIVRFARITPLNDFLAVTFHSASIEDEGPRKAGFDMPGFGQSFLRKHGINAVHVLVSRSHWYQTPEMESALAFIRHIAKDYRRVVTYGSSMGGYAAIKFAPQVSANTAIAISPQYSIDPEKAPFEKRFLKYFRREAWTNDTFVRDAHQGISSYVFYDPFDDDGIHFNLLDQHVAGIIPVKVPFGGHPAGMQLTELRILQPAVLDIIVGDFDVGAFSVLRARARKSSEKFMKRLHGLAQMRSRSRRSLITGSRLYTLGWMSLDLKLKHANRLRVAGYEREASAIFAEIEAIGNARPKDLTALGKACMRQKDYAKAIDVYGQIVRLDPENVFASEQLTIAKNRLRRQQKAIAASTGA
jgi:pimeloyl-ACP methyl ester carboxylesterase